MKLAVIIAIAILGFVSPRPSHGQDVATERDPDRAFRRDGRAELKAQGRLANLRGSLPPSLVQLRNLKGLNVANNQLRGDIPGALLKMADDNVLDLQYYGTLVSQLLSRVSIQVDQFFGMCTSDMRLQFQMQIDGSSNRAVYQSVRCSGEGKRRAPICRKAEINTAPPLDDVSRALMRLGFPTAKSSGSAAGLSDDAEHLRANLTWGDGKSQTLVRHAGRAPMDAWIGYELLLALEPPGWETTAAQVPCDSLKWIAQ